MTKSEHRIGCGATPLPLYPIGRHVRKSCMCTNAHITKGIKKKITAVGHYEP